MLINLNLFIYIYKIQNKKVAEFLLLSDKCEIVQMSVHVAVNKIKVKKLSIKVRKAEILPPRYNTVYKVITRPSRPCTALPLPTSHH